jgi:hypothetical protein
MDPMKEMKGALGHQYLSNLLYPFILGGIEIASSRTKITFPAAGNAFMRNQANNGIPHLHRRHLRQMRDNSSSAGALIQMSAKNLGGQPGMAPRTLRLSIRPCRSAERPRRASRAAGLLARNIAPYVLTFVPKATFPRFTTMSTTR